MSLGLPDLVAGHVCLLGSVTLGSGMQWCHGADSSKVGQEVREIELG